MTGSVLGSASAPLMLWPHMGCVWNCVSRGESCFPWQQSLCYSGDGAKSQPWGSSAPRSQTLHRTGASDNELLEFPWGLRPLGCALGGGQMP